MFEGIKGYDPNTQELRTLNNSLLESIIEKRNDNAGYFELLNVRMSFYTYCDIYIIIDGEAKKNPGFDKLV